MDEGYGMGLQGEASWFAGRVGVDTVSFARPILLPVKTKVPDRLLPYIKQVFACCWGVLFHKRVSFNSDGFGQQIVVRGAPLR